MLTATDDLRIRSITELATPEEVIDEFPLTPQATRTVSAVPPRPPRHPPRRKRPPRRRRRPLLDPRSRRRPRLRRAPHRRSASGSRDNLEIVMRVYFEKPRTTVGWKGLINDPDLDGSFQIDKGLRLARNLLLEINNLGLPAGTRIPRHDHARSTSPTSSPGARSARAPPSRRSTASSPPASAAPSASRTAPTAT